MEDIIVNKQISGLFLALCMACLLLLPACGNGTAASSPAAVSASPAATAAESAPAQKTIKPMPAELDLNALEDCTFAASFRSSDVSLNSDGALVIHMTVCDYERFDMVDISQLAVGDTLVLGGKDIVVKTIDNSSGDIAINGGADAGGCVLHTDEDGVYYAVTPDAGYTYYELGEVTLPVGQDFVYTDNSDPAKPGQTSYAGDFLTAMKDSSAEFPANATTVRVAGGKIVELTKNYMP